jgi:hypothetical protein
MTIMSKENCKVFGKSPGKLFIKHGKKILIPYMLCIKIM